MTDYNKGIDVDLGPLIARIARWFEREEPAPEKSWLIHDHSQFLCEQVPELSYQDAFADYCPDTGYREVIEGRVTKKVNRTDRPIKDYRPHNFKRGPEL